ncbi:hypothetical protein [Desulfovibrio inopinatus]|uniref:hypothetical protein n=1 Tax=Desulfovibrio inopinatus TaxID=102109 RepID=UPI00040DBC56|nr:hypothetical protein [Desulfovibrio inopinatus]
MIEEARLDAMIEYMRSGQLEEDFKYSAPDRRGEILDILEKLMDAAEIANEVATRLIFKDSYLGTLTGMNADT